MDKYSFKAYKTSNYKILLKYVFVISSGLLAGTVLANNYIPPRGSVMELAKSTIINVSEGVTHNLPSNPTSGQLDIVIQSTKRVGVVNWGDFGTGPGDKLTFKLPGNNAALLNRVLGGKTSAILGTSQISIPNGGQVYIVNPSGVVILGDLGTLDSGSLILSQLDIDPSKFVNEQKEVFTQNGKQLEQGIDYSRGPGIFALTINEQALENRKLDATEISSFSAQDSQFFTDPSELKQDQPEITVDNTYTEEPKTPDPGVTPPNPGVNPPNPGENPTDPGDKPTDPEVPPPNPGENPSDNNSGSSNGSGDAGSGDNGSDETINNGGGNVTPPPPKKPKVPVRVKRGVAYLAAEQTVKLLSDANENISYKVTAGNSEVPIAGAGSQAGNLSFVDMVAAVNDSHSSSSATVDANGNISFGGGQSVQLASADSSSDSQKSTRSSKAKTAYNSNTVKQTVVNKRIKQSIEDVPITLTSTKVAKSGVNINNVSKVKTSSAKVSKAKVATSSIKTSSKATASKTKTLATASAYNVVNKKSTSTKASVTPAKNPTKVSATTVKETVKATAKATGVAAVATPTTSTAKPTVAPSSQLQTPELKKEIAEVRTASADIASSIAGYAVDQVVRQEITTEKVPDSVASLRARVRARAAAAAAAAATASNATANTQEQQPTAPENSTTPVVNK